jgi:plasmid maintenance system antidote protein VapI
MNNIIKTKTKLRAFLDERGIRYVWVADKLGISPPHLHHIMEGARPLTEELANRLADLFDVPASTFLPEAPDA